MKGDADVLRSREANDSRSSSMDGCARSEHQICLRPIPNTASTASLISSEPRWLIGIYQKAKTIRNGLAWGCEPHARSISQETSQRPRSTARHPGTDPKSNRIVGEKDSRVDGSTAISRPSTCDPAEGAGGSGKRRDQETIEFGHRDPSTHPQQPYHPRYFSFRWPKIST